MGETYSNTNFLTHRGVPVIDDGPDLCPGNVGGHIVAIPFAYRVGATEDGTLMKYVGSTVTKFETPKDGSLIGASFYANTACDAGHCTFTVHIGAVASDAVLFNMNSVAGETRSGYVWQNKDVDEFTAGQEISVVMNGATLTTSTIGLTLFIEV